MATVASIESKTEENSYYPPRPRRFAPLDPGKAEHAGRLPKLRGVIFDVDGTLCLPQNYMFKQMREALQIPKSVDILDHIRTLSNEPDQPKSAPVQPHSATKASLPPSEQTLDHTADEAAPQPATTTSPQARAVAMIQAIERSAMTNQTPQPGLAEIMTYLDSRSILRGLCTRNFPAPVQHLVDKFLAPHGVTFKVEEVITRDTEGIQPKPSPEGLWSIAKYWATTHSFDMNETVHEKVDGATDDDVLTVARKYLGSGLIMVGDSIDDMAAGYRAGAATVLLLNDDNERIAEHEYTDLAIRRLDDLASILEKGFVGNASS